jgi:hypothetical protein
MENRKSKLDGVAFFDFRSSLFILLSASASLRFQYGRGEKKREGPEAPPLRLITRPVQK